MDAEPELVASGEAEKRGRWHGTGSPGAETPPPPPPQDPAHSVGARGIGPGGPGLPRSGEAPAADSFAAPGSSRECQSEYEARGGGFGRAVRNLGVLRGWGAGLPGGGRLWDGGP